MGTIKLVMYCLSQSYCEDMIKIKKCENTKVISEGKMLLLLCENDDTSILLIGSRHCITSI